MGRKSVDLTQEEEHELTIVKNKRKATVDDYLPPYTSRFILYHHLPIGWYG